LIFQEEQFLKLFKNKIFVLLFFVIISLPLLIGTFDTTNWSDDYQQTNLLPIKASISPLFPTILERTGGHAEGGHFAPVYILINYVFTLVTFDPRFFHFLIVCIYILTAFFIYLIVYEYSNDRLFGLLSGVLFSVNYYIGFFGLTWNCMHVHVTNTFTGTLSIFFLFRYLKFRKPIYFLSCAGCLLLTILNFENGFIFFPILFIISFFAFKKNEIDLKKFIAIGLVFLLIAVVYSTGAYLSSGKAMPLLYRFKKGYKHQQLRSAQGYAYLTNDLLIKSTGLTIFYNKFIFNKLKDDLPLKESIKKLIRNNDIQALKEISLKNRIIFFVLGLSTILMGIFILIVIFTRIRKENYVFLWIYACLFPIYILLFYRNDVVNALSMFSSIIIADLIISFLRDTNINKRRIGLGISSLILIATVWTIFDRFEDCYQKSYFGLSTIAIKGPDQIYNKINQKIGRFIEHGIILFKHDHSQYHYTTGFERIGDMISLEDFVCYNATVFYKDLLKTDIPRIYKNKTMSEFSRLFYHNPNNKLVLVSVKSEAFEYLKQNNIDLNKMEAIYISDQYDVHRLNDELAN